MIVFDVKDQRKIGDGCKINVTDEKLMAIAEAVEIPVDSLVEVRLRLRDAKKGKPRGTCEPLGDGLYRIVLYLLPKAELSDKAKYAINSSLVHEMRHVAQYESFGVVAVAMESEQYEQEAREYGHKARVENDGEALWAVA